MAREIMLGLVAIAGIGGAVVLALHGIAVPAGLVGVVGGAAAYLMQTPLSASVSGGGKGSVQP